MESTFDTGRRVERLCTFAHWPYRQDARPPVPWRHNVEGADKHNTRDIDQHKGVRGQCAAHGGASEPLSERAAARRGGLSNMRAAAGNYAETCSKR